MIGKEHFGIGNCLQCDDIAGAEPREWLGDDDPRNIQRKLGVAELQRKLFPLIQTGVRFWPYLLVARDLVHSSDSDVKTAMRKLRKDIRERVGKDYARQIGPRDETRFVTYLSPYWGMYRKIDEQSGNNAKALRELLGDGRRRYTGSRETFESYARDWRAALKASMGDNSRQFATLLNDLIKPKRGAKSDEISKSGEILDDSISALLSTDSYSDTLRQAAFCFAFLRCVYGAGGAVENIKPVTAAKVWAGLLEEALIGKDAAFGRFRTYQFLNLIKGSYEKPALAKKHKDAAREGARVLAGLGFHTFFNLYVRHSPQRPSG